MQHTPILPLQIPNPKQYISPPPKQPLKSQENMENLVEILPPIPENPRN